MLSCLCVCWWIVVSFSSSSPLLSPFFTPLYCFLSWECGQPPPEARVQPHRDTYLYPLSDGPPWCGVHYIDLFI
ncbi:uncharacterized protein BDW47DRAFT_93150 [Aspergillus candidus]|uniref:Secreted protein n=1 Tax=Aspergillus candidus TaxID=41067 RepID=A0A2I2FHV6_ASPCN|nr:hypothetical protein BDW47DRAFT_93150 [Aspergillus candidus]PLB40202.1 hypothetical protein BDW47DRAFT_93150 [Aspergillus candidus]